MARTFLTALFLGVMLSQGAVMAQPGIQGEASLMEGEGILSLLQDPGLAALPGASADLMLHSGSGRPDAALLEPVQAEFVAIRQIGSGNLVEFSASDSDNAIDLIQYGSDNQAVVTQHGHGNILIQRQQGNDLGIEVTQYGGARIEISQSGY